MRALKIFGVAVAVIVGGFVARAANFAHVEGRDIIGTDGKPLLIRGTNLGNWLVPEGYMWRMKGGVESPREIEALIETLLGPDKAAAFWQGYRDRYVTQADIAYLARAGCNTIRVPLHYKLFLDANGEGFHRLDRVVEWSRAAKVYLILDLHCAPGGQTGTNIDDSRGYPWLFESATAQEQLFTVWRNLARHYRDEPVVLGYDLLNEPLPSFPYWEHLKPMLEPLFNRLTLAVREIDPNHIVFLTGAHWDSDFKILGAPPAKNVAYTFHKYWVPVDEKEIRSYLDFRDKYNVPLWCGETGENKDDWIASFRQLLESNQVGWTYWPFKKMDNTSGFLRFARPVHWDKITNFAKQPGGTGSDQVKANLLVRPTPQEIEECFKDLLEKIQLSQCEPNKGYIEALGLTVPGKE